MTQLLARSLTVLKCQGTITKLFQEQLKQSAGASTVLVAHLTSYHGQKAPRKKPFPYKSKDFRYWHIPFDRVDSRLDDNSKIIVIDGNIATGKTELGKKIAKEFDLLYVPDVTDTEFYTVKETNFDVREYDELLPPKARSCDFERFYSQKGSKEVLKNVAYMQYMLFRHKVYRYAQEVMAHVLNTGQGVVMNRGMWSDMVWAHTLRKQGFMSPQALKAYQYQYEVSADYLWHPHLVIYLDAPVDLVKKNLRNRNVPWELKSPVLKDEFFHAMSDSYKNKFIPYIKTRSEVLTYDLSESPVPDFEVVVEDLESLDLDNPPLEYPKRFSEWTNVHNRDFNDMRSFCTPRNKFKLRNIFNFLPPYEAPELVLDGMDKVAYQKVVEQDPRYMYDAKFQPGNSAILFKV